MTDAVPAVSTLSSAAPITRKAFLRVIGSMAALGCGLASAVSAAPVLAAAGLGPRTADCGAAMFAAHLHTRFRVSDDAGHRADLVLTHVDELACDSTLEQFSLVFEGAGGQSSLAGTCRFDHPALGR